MSTKYTPKSIVDQLREEFPGAQITAQEDVILEIEFPEKLTLTLQAKAEALIGRKLKEKTKET